MTNVRVPATWIAVGYHPRVCVRHGGPATADMPRSFHTKSNRWLLFLLLLTPLVWIIVSLAVRKSVKGPVPTCSLCAHERQRDLSILVGTWVLAASLLPVAITMASAVWGALCAVAVLAGLVLLLLRDRNRVTGTLDNEQIWVALRGVHPAYAQLIFQAVHQPNAAPQGEYGYGPSGAAPAAHFPRAAAHRAKGHRAAAPDVPILPAPRHGRPAGIEHTLLGEQSPQ